MLLSFCFSVWVNGSPEKEVERNQPVELHQPNYNKEMYRYTIKMIPLDSGKS